MYDITGAVSLWDHLAETSKPIIIYGMGDGAQKILDVQKRFSNSTMLLIQRPQVVQTHGEVVIIVAVGWWPTYSTGVVMILKVVVRVHFCLLYTSDYFSPATSNTISPDNEGFIQRWLLLEPIDKPNRCLLYTSRCV